LDGWKKRSSNLSGPKTSAVLEQIEQLGEEEWDGYLYPLLKYSCCILFWGGLFDPSLDWIIWPVGDFGLLE
jgi:hypothetical protein